MKPSFCLIISMCMLFTLSCRKLIEVKENPNLIDASSVFATDNSAVSAISGLYAQLKSSSFVFAPTLYLGLAADEIANTGSSSAADPFKANALLPNNNVVLGSFWTPLYQNIYRANAILQAAEASPSLTPNLKKQILGEALTIRSFLYFYLVNVFGDVPLITSTDYKLNATVSRTPTNKIYDQMISDLLKAKENLSAKDIDPARGRVNKWVVSALLARVYLYGSLPAKAEDEATAVIESSQYVLEPVLSKVFLNTSRETIWQLVNDDGNTQDAKTFVPFSSTSRPAYALTKSLLSSFEQDDQRRIVWVDSNKVGNPSVIYYYPAKYRMRSATPVVEFPIVMRLAEVYLIRAEARNNADDLDGAREDLNVIRSRAGLPDTPATTKESLAGVIAHERRIELFAEWGHRWLDLKRTKMLNSVMQLEKGSDWQSTDSLFPIPESQLLLNVFLTQNPGY